MIKAIDFLLFLEDAGLQEVPEAAIGGRQLASSSDKAKYAGIKKQLDDIDKKKAGYHDTISKEADDAKRAAAQKALHDIRDKEQALLKVRKDMLSKFRGLRSKN